jgi:hypothetical protein
MVKIAPLVYLLCLLASVLCAGLLVRSYVRNRTPLLMWSAICFVLLAVNNLLVVIDLIVLPAEIDLTLGRHITSLAAVSTLLYGFIWASDE